MKEEIQGYLNDCKWFRIYDVIENFYKELNSQNRNSFEDKINDYFFENGIGWKLEHGKIIARGDIYFEDALRKTKSA